MKFRPWCDATGGRASAPGSSDLRSRAKGRGLTFLVLFPAPCWDPVGVASRRRALSFALPFLVWGCSCPPSRFFTPRADDATGSVGITGGGVGEGLAPTPICEMRRAIVCARVCRSGKETRMEQARGLGDMCGYGAKARM